MKFRKSELYKKLQEPIQVVVDSIINDKILQFPIEIYDFEESLLEAKIMQITNGEYEIIDYEIISFPFLDFYKKQFSFEPTKDFKKSSEFLNRIKQDFYSKGYVTNFSDLEDKLWKLFITEANEKYSCDFNNYLQALDKKKEPNEILSFIEAYSACLQNLNISAKICYENSIVLLELIKSDVDYNLPLATITGGIKQKCKYDISFGVELFNYCYIVPDINDNILASVVSGLFEAKQSFIFEDYLNPKLMQNKGVKAILIGLSNIFDLSEDDCNIYFKIINQFETVEELKIPALALSIAILKSTNNKFYDACFEKILNSIKDERIVYYILTSLAFIKDCKEKKTAVLLSIVKQEYFAIEKHLRGIEYFFRHFREVDAFKSVIVTIAVKFPFTPITEGFYSISNHSNKIELDKLIIELLTDNRASIRFIGSNLFDEISARSPYKFTYNILLLEPILQYKLCIALTQDFKEPKYHIQALLPLLDSKNEIVKEAFICKLEEISEDYGGHVIEILEANLDSEKYKLIIQRVKDYVSNFYSLNIDIKNTINELNPYFTHPKYIGLYNKLFHKRMSQSVNKEAEKNSLISILGVDAIQLAKGGGWKISNRKEISKLGSFGTSFSLPRSYFINPNEYELRKGIGMKSDWDDFEFNEIAKLLINE